MARLYTDEPTGENWDWASWEERRREAIRADIRVIADRAERETAMAKFNEWCAANPTRNGAKQC